MSDLELDRKVATNWQEYKAEFLQMRNMIGWVWTELVSREGRAFMLRMVGWMTFSCLLTVVLPLMFGKITDLLDPKKTEVRTLLIMLAIYGALLLLRQLIRYKQSITREYLGGENMRQLDVRTTELFLEKSLGMHISESNHLNEANVKKGYDRVLGLEGMLLFEGIEALLNIALPFIALWIFTITSGRWAVGLIIMLILASHLAWTLFLNQQVLRICLPIDKMWRFLNRYRVERWQRVERVKTNAKEEAERREIERLFDQAIQPDRKFWFWFIRQATYRNTIADALLFTLIAYCVRSVWVGDMALGSLWFLVSWGSQFSTTLWHIGHIEHQFNFYTPSIMGMKEALTVPIGLRTFEQPTAITPAQPFRVEFESVGYHYEHQSPDKDAIPTLENVSFTIEPGEKVALIGPSGAGKSTIMKLLLRYMDPTEGRIRIDGVDLRQIQLGTWLSQIGYVAQQFEVFDGTIRYNLTYGLSEERKRTITDDDIWNVMRMLQIDFGDRLIDGLDTRIGFNGIKLSGGQNQRLMIGAAALKEPRFMIIDEATSSLDATTERLVQDGLARVLHNCGALIVTHRLNTVRRICDRFILLDRDEGCGGTIHAIADSFEALAEISPAFRGLAIDQGIELGSAAKSA
jgi:ABC-type multidrug transport system fused ATPase/permease subunit